MLFVVSVESGFGRRWVEVSDLRKGQIFVFLTSMAWGSSFVVIRWGVDFLNPFVYLFFRFVVASVVTLPFLRWVGAGGLRELFFDGRVVFVGLINTLAFFCEFVGMEYTTAGISALLTNVNVVIIALLAYFFLGENMERRKIVALALSILGVFLIAVNGDIANLQGGEFLGNFLILVSGALWAVYIVVMKVIVDNKSHRHSEVNSMNLTYAVTLMTMIFSLFPVLIYGFEDFSLISQVATVPALMGILYMGFICTTLAYFLYFEGLKRVSASVSGLYLLLQIIFAVGLGFLLLGEVPTIHTLIGGALIGVSIYLVS